MMPKRALVMLEPEASGAQKPLIRFPRPMPSPSRRRLPHRFDPWLMDAALCGCGPMRITSTAVIKYLAITRVAPVHGVYVSLRGA